MVGPFALFVVEKSFLDGSEDLAVGALNDAVGLRVVYRGEDRLGADGETEIPEVLAIKLFAVVDCEFGRDSEVTDNVLWLSNCLSLSTMSSDGTPKRQTMFC